MSVQTPQTTNSNEPDTIDDLNVSTIIETWEMQSFTEKESQLTGSTTTKAVYWNPDKTRSLKIGREIKASGDIITIFELADISSESTEILDSRAKY